MENKKKVFVGMSGGVDSSVAAYLLKKQGYDVVGVFMRCYNIDGCAEKDAEDAREYKQKVVEYMVAGYRAGLTPNPDVMCNKEIKFGMFLERALKMGADYVATGHYVRLIKKPSLILAQAKDKNKDQSYFLWTLTQEQLKHCLFPIGDYIKPDVRKIAKKAGLSTAEKKDSQGICFLGNVRIEDFLKNYIPEKRGHVLTLAGEVVGEHKGAHFYTIGQRHIGVQLRGSAAKADRAPFYVAEKNVETNTVVLAEGDANDALYRKEVELAEINLVRPFAKGEHEVFARVRYRQPLARATVSFDGKKNNAKLVFAKPQKFVASGQSAVLYSKKGEMLGGGVIL